MQRRTRREGGDAIPQNIAYRAAVRGEQTIEGQVRSWPGDVADGRERTHSMGGHLRAMLPPLDDAPGQHAHERWHWRRRLRRPALFAAAVVVVVVAVIYSFTRVPSLPDDRLPVVSVEHSGSLLPSHATCTYSGDTVAASATFKVAADVPVQTQITVDVLGPRGEIAVIRSGDRTLAPRAYPWHDSTRVTKTPTACAFVFHGYAIPAQDDRSP